MVMKCSPVCLMALVLLGSLCDAQWKQQTPPKKDPSKKQPQTPQQIKQEFEETLDWKYPEDPVAVIPPEVHIEIRHPIATATVSVQCRENEAYVEVKKDMFANGQFVNPADLSLGSCEVMGEHNHVLIFESQLHACGSSLAMTEDSLIYTWIVNYNPKPLGDSPVVRTNHAAVIVECHYPRKHNVSSLALIPQWTPFSAVKVSEEFLYFTLKLKTDDWVYERPSYQYFLGDMIHIEAIVKQFFHVPLRIYVDRCVATVGPDMDSQPSYAFIENHGCFVDAKVTGSDSKFRTRSEENKLQFQLEAFRFQGSDSGLLYITCHLKATSAALAIDSDHRACSYTGGWEEASGANSVCGSCDSVSAGGTNSASWAVSSLGNPSYPSAGGSNTGSRGSATPGNPSYPSTGGSNTGSRGSATLGNPSYPSAGGSNTGSRGSTSPTRKVRDVSKTAESEVFEWEGDVTLGPFAIGEKVIA
ncbi:zona pellucida sperm-binding protein 3-like [Labrus mixtus]|uniref:zona pellucida sperm-binding protein 3-like n=1 Tax=Labrus mixtus TaxID=508554 RepID=UPI0029C0B69B|nr:zona pellucida sperm-binding protein 3-like [Labrus mixtus]